MYRLEALRRGVTSYSTRLSCDRCCSRKSSVQLLEGHRTSLQEDEVLIPAAVFIGLHDGDCCGCCGRGSCGKGCAMLSSVLAAFVGILGSGYCVIISALGLSHGPYCFTHLERNWVYPFAGSSGGYLFEYNKWSECQEPQNIVQWNVTLFSILLVVGGIEFILCFIQIINGIVGGLCGLCCSHEETYVC